MALRELLELVPAAQAAQPIATRDHRRGDHQCTHAIAVPRRQQGDAAAKTGPVQADPVGIDTGPRGEKLQRMRGVLDLLVGHQPATHTPATAKAAIVETQHGIAMCCEPGRQTHRRPFLDAAEAQAKHHAGAAVVGRIGQIKLSGQAQSRPGKEAHILDRHGSGSVQRIASVYHERLSNVFEAPKYVAIHPPIHLDAIAHRTDHEVEVHIGFGELA